MHTNEYLENNRQQINMWYCADCTSVHFRVGAVMLNFTREEFSALTNACVEVYCEEFGILNELMTSKLPKNEEDVLSSDLIS